MIAAIFDAVALLAIYAGLCWLMGEQITVAGYALVIAFCALVQGNRASRDLKPLRDLAAARIDLAGKKPNA